MSENVKRRQEMERRIVRRALTEGKKLGYTFNINNGGDEHELPEPTDDVRKVLGEMFATDDEHLLFYRGRFVKGWVYFVYGNGNGGLDVVSDYTTNLEPVMAKVQELVNKYS